MFYNALILIFCTEEIQSPKDFSGAPDDANVIDLEGLKCLSADLDFFFFKPYHSGLIIFMCLYY